ncbi:glutaredoxin-like protein [Salmonella enterica]|uniref:Glutaredoxin-like protein n=1 Tax=Salmonella sp. NCTC 6947 TaxID=2583581 RepID=A0A509BNZ8_9ENTR|nr:glutaredoxin-like protein [Salmonella enterica]
MSITIYTRNNCVQCHATKRAMESRGFEFEMVNVDLVPDASGYAPGARVSSITGGDGGRFELVWLPSGHD